MPTPETSEIPSAPADDTDTLLSDFDNGSASVRPDAGVTPQAPAVEPPPLSFTDRLLQKAAERDQRLADARKPKGPEAAPQNTAEREELQQLRTWAEGIEAERMAERERVEAQEVFDRSGEVVQEIAPWLPGDYARTWFINEAMTDPVLADAWENRHASPEAAGIAQRQIDRSMRKLGKHLRGLPDPVATDDRAVVTAAMRGASGRAPPEAPPNYSSMSDADFNRELKTKYGIDNSRI